MSTTITAETDITTIDTATLAALTSLELKSLTRTQLGALSSVQLSAFSASLVSMLPLKYIPTGALAGILTGSISGLAVKSLSVDQIAGLSSTQLPALTTTQMAALQPAQFNTLTSIGALSSTQLGAIKATSLKGLTTDSISNMTTDTVVALTSLQLAKLTTVNGGQLEAFTPAQVAHFSTAAITWLHNQSFSTIRGIATTGSGIETSGITTVTVLMPPVSVNGGTGNDLIAFNCSVTNTSIDGGTGDDAIIFNNAVTDTTITGGAGIDTVTLGNFANTLSVIDVEQVTGGTGADSITGSASSDTIIGGSGADTITGGAGADSITGGTGNDGNDVYKYNTGDSIIDSVDSLIGEFSGYTFDTVKLNNAVGTLYVSVVPSEGISALTVDAINTFLSGQPLSGVHFKGGTNTSIAQLTYGTSKYWAIDLDGDGTFNSTNDLLINVTGSTLTNVTVETFGVRLPTLSTITNVTAATEDTEKEISFSDLIGLANEADTDGTVTAFVVKSVNSGTLKIGTLDFNATTNATIDSDHAAHWTPAANANGLAIDAFSVVAKDNGGYESITPVSVQVAVTAVNNAPTATNLDTAETYTEDTPLNLTGIVIVDDSATVTATLTLSNTAAGSLNVGTSTAVTSTFNVETGVWTASGAIADVNALLSGLTFTPTLNFNSNFTVTTRVSDGIASALTGSKSFTGTAVNDAPSFSVALSGGSGAVSFQAKTDFATGVNPQDIKVGDFNADTKPDLAVANRGSDNVSVLLNNGSGGFGTKTDFATGLHAGGIGVGDFNADGKPDLAVANIDANNVSVLLNNGSGGWVKTDFTTGAIPVMASVGDFNADGKPDLAVANWTGDSVSVLLNNGSGGFGAKTDFPTGTTASDVSVGDFNADGKPDLAVANYHSNTVSVLLNNGDGIFVAKTDFPTEDAPISVSVGDFNADGQSDLAVANNNSNTVSVLLNTGNGSFGAKTDFATGTSPASVSVGDFNADGKPDLAVANAGNGTVSVLLNNGNGGFGTKTDFATGTDPRSISVGDFNTDGKLDLAVANFVSNTVSVLLNNTDPLFIENGSPVILSSAITLNDADLAATNYSGSTLTFARLVGESIVANVEDVFSGSGLLSFSGASGNFVFNSTTIGTFTNSGGTLAITFNASATETLVNQALALISYSNSSDNPPASVQIARTFDDGSGQTNNSATGLTTVNIAAVNDAPTAINLSASEAFTEDASVFSLTDIVVTDVDSANITATLTLSYIAAGSLNVDNSNDVTSTFNVGTGVWTASGAIADVNALLAGLTFTPTLNFNSDFTIATSIDDGVAEAITGSKAVTVTPISSPPANNAPTATNLDAAETYTEDTPLNLIDMVISDVDSATVTATLTLSNAVAGSLNIGSSNGVIPTFSSGVWSVTGAIADVNALLAGLTFTPTLNFNSDFTVITNVSDGIASPLTGSKSFTGTAVNDAPTATDTTQTFNEDTTKTFAAADFGYADVDNNLMASVKIVTLPALGLLKLGGDSVTANQVIPTASIPNLTYTPVANANGTNYSNFTFTVNDGSLDSVSNNTMTLNVTPVNDAPTGGVTISGTYGLTLGSLLTATKTNTITDIDGLGGFSYEWKADRVKIIGASSSTYTLTAPEVGKVISVEVSYTDGGGTLETVVASVASYSGSQTGTEISGTTGDDTMSFVSASNSTIIGYSGDDTISFSSTISNSTMYAGTGDDTISITGAAGNDSIITDTGNDTLSFGEVTNTTVNTGTGDDTISITGAAGYDSIITDTGNDTLSFGIVTNTTVNSGTGDDIMTFGSTVTSSTITGNEGVDSMTFTGAAQSDVINGGTGNDTLTFGLTVTSSTVTGDEGVDSMTFTGAAQSDVISGGTGTDTLTFGSTVTSSTVNGNEDADSMTFTGAVASTTITGGTGSDVITFQSTVANSSIDGSEGLDVITFQAAATNTTVNGGVDSDSDTITIVDSVENSLTILGFTPAKDILQLGGNVAVTAGTVLAPPADVAHTIIFDTIAHLGTLGLLIGNVTRQYPIHYAVASDTGQVFYDADGNWLTGSVQVVTVGVGLTATDFRVA